MTGWINANGEQEKTALNLHNHDRSRATNPEPRFTGGWISGASGEIAPDLTIGEYLAVVLA